MDIWKTTTQTNDVVNYNARNTYIEISLKSSKKASNTGHTDVKLDCWTRVFKIINHQRIYKPEEDFKSNTYEIDEGKIVFWASETMQHAMKFT